MNTEDISNPKALATDFDIASNGLVLPGDTFTVVLRPQSLYRIDRVVIPKNGVAPFFTVQIVIRSSPGTVPISDVDYGEHGAQEYNGHEYPLRDERFKTIQPTQEIVVKARNVSVLRKSFGALIEGLMAL
jgi:hypothetical protein